MFNVLLLGEVEAGDEKSFWINILAAAAYGLAGLLIVGLYRLTRRVYSSREFSPR